MKNLFKLVFIFFISNFIFSQSGTVTYDVRMDIDLTSTPKDKVDFITKMVGYANNQKFELSFNKKKSSFKYIEQLSSPDFETKTENIARLAFTSSDIYIDYETKSEIHIKNDGILVQNKYDEIKWEITTESKVIQSYVCYKAIQNTTFIDKKGESRNKQVIAWFAPVLPYSYGPKNFYGLPGLILELTENKTTFLATKISLDKNEVIIDFPKGKTITKAEYEKKMKAQMGM
jgi:GLPGLI family protein